MGIGILRCLSTERTCLNHIHQSSFQLKAVISGLVLVQSSRNVATGRGRELTKSLLAMGYEAEVDGELMGQVSLF